MKKRMIYIVLGTVISGAITLFLVRNNPSNCDKETLIHHTDSLACVETCADDVDITEISAKEYRQLIKDSCNVRLLIDSTKFTETSDSLTIFTANKKITLLNLPYDEEVASDFSIKWQYDGFDNKSKLSFFSFSGYENWGYYAINNTGFVSRFYANGAPVFSKNTVLFATWFMNPYEGKSTLNVYKILSDGRLAEIFVVELAEEYECTPNPIWIAKNVLVAAKHRSDEEISE